ncbi:MAG: hypothetical protein MZV64_17570 [Ignavibacteriales bacterium]|nr:hypothetical protein [Ignavibacteriales bacterium]
MTKVSVRPAEPADQFGSDPRRWAVALLRSSAGRLSALPTLGIALLEVLSHHVERAKPPVRSHLLLCISMR